MSSGFPKVERLSDGRTRYEWTAKLGRQLEGSLSELSERLRESALARYRQTLRDQGFVEDADAGLQLEVALTEVGQALYQLEVKSAGEAPNWDIASLFTVMQAFDEAAGPALEIQGRSRSDCPPWFLRAEDAVSDNM